MMPKNAKNFGRLVLVADDEPDILSTAKQILDLFGYPSVLVQEAGAIFDMALERKPMVILQDMLMPGLQLQKLVQQLHAHPDTKGIPIVLFSASAAVQETVKKVGVDGFILKPFDLKQLRAMLEKYAAQTQS